MTFDTFVGTRTRLTGALALIIGFVVGPFAGLGAAQAQEVQPEPRQIAITAEEVGRGLELTAEDEGADDRARWVRLRWERNPNPGVTAGPAVIENRVWTARDEPTAQAIFTVEAARQTEFPEAAGRPAGPFELPVGPIGDEVVALSACDDCLTDGAVNLHHRVVLRQGSVVSVVYTYGPESMAPPGQATWLAARLASRMPGLLAEGDLPELGATQVARVQARPRDLAISLSEAGKNAELAFEMPGEDARAVWYQVRYERPRSAASFRSGPVTIFNDVFLARDLATAQEIYREQVARNESFPEAREPIGDPFTVGIGAIGDEAAGFGACVESCNAATEIYVHKRVVSRTGPVVSVVYLWGLADPEGTTDWHARHFAALVEGRTLTAPVAVQDSAVLGFGAPAARAIKTRPLDAALSWSEAGKNAQVAGEQHGADGLVSWYQVRYERPRTYAGFRSGPVTVVNRVLVARDVDVAEHIYRDQVALNDGLPEARERIGDRFALDAGQTAEQAEGLSACTGSCDARSVERHVHKRLVSRSGDVVSVVYLWGLDHPEGTTDWHARHFAALVEGRIVR